MGKIFNAITERLFSLIFADKIERKMYEVRGVFAEYKLELMADRKSNEELTMKFRRDIERSSVDVQKYLNDKVAQIDVDLRVAKNGYLSDISSLGSRAVSDINKKATEIGSELHDIKNEYTGILQSAGGHGVAIMQNKLNEALDEIKAKQEHALAIIQAAANNGGSCGCENDGKKRNLFGYLQSLITTNFVLDEEELEDAARALNLASLWWVVGRAYVGDGPTAKLKDIPRGMTLEMSFWNCFEDIKHRRERRKIKNAAKIGNAQKNS